MIMDHGRIPADGTSEQLKEAFAHSRVYELEFRADGDRHEELIRALPFIESLERRGRLSPARCREKSI
ncbi:MAG: hypothetical protein M0C28_21255 [Candidatus Moduliflexus flocculans]|nr:hypothetical protein [Candidatus Moduliflexus flocculans]